MGIKIGFWLESASFLTTSRLRLRLSLSFPSCHWPSMGGLPKPLHSQGLELVHSSLFIKKNVCAESATVLGVVCISQEPLSRVDVSWPSWVFHLLPLCTERSKCRGTYKHDKVQGEMGKKSYHDMKEQSAQPPFGSCYENWQKEKTLFPTSAPGTQHR